MVLCSEKQTLLSSAKHGEVQFNQPEKPDNFDQRAHAEPHHDGDEYEKDEHAAAQRAKEKAVAENAAVQKAAAEKNGDMQTASRPTDEDDYDWPSSTPTRIRKVRLTQIPGCRSPL